MMKRLLALALVAGGLLAMAGCYCAPVKPPVGFFYSNFNAPISVDYNKNNPAPKTGVSSSESILGLISWGDASVKAAADQAGIGTIEHADYRFFNVLGVYQKFETIVYGK